MLFRQCAGGLVFFNDKVLLLQNEKNEWVFPKGVIRNLGSANEVALQRVKEEAGIKAEIVSPIGETNYEFYSCTRQEPVCNQITWFLMKSDSGKYQINKELNFKNGGFFNIIDALSKVTYSQDKALLNIAYKQHKEL